MADVFIAIREWMAEQHTEKNDFKQTKEKCPMHNSHTGFNVIHTMVFHNQIYFFIAFCRNFFFIFWTIYGFWEQ